MSENLLQSENDRRASENPLGFAYLMGAFQGNAVLSEVEREERGGG